MKVIRCPECSQDVVSCDNGIFLDHPAQPWDEYGASWTLMRFGDQIWATNGDPSPDGRGHKMHEHQPKDD